jgi:hypothetical protein
MSGVVCLLGDGEGAWSSGSLTASSGSASCPLLPQGARTGRPRADDRRTLNGILYVPVTGCGWAAGHLRRPRPPRLLHDRLESFGDEFVKNSAPLCLRLAGTVTCMVGDFWREGVNAGALGLV